MKPSPHLEDSEPRSPASIARQQMLGQLRIDHPDLDHISVDIGGFSVPGDGNTLEFACDYYDRVDLVFEAEGTAISGEKPELTVEGPCIKSPDANHVEPLTIPVKELLNNKPLESQYKFDQPGGMTQISLDHAPPEWPSTWNLKEIRMSHSQIPSRNLSIPVGDDGKPVLMTWSK